MHKYNIANISKLQNFVQLLQVIYFTC